MLFKTWFMRNLSEYAQDIANYGADAGYPFITYFTDTDLLYKEFESEIWEMLCLTADELGYENNMQLIQTFRRQDMLESFYKTGVLDSAAKCLLVWFAIEEFARDAQEQKLSVI